MSSGVVLRVFAIGDWNAPAPGFGRRGCWLLRQRHQLFAERLEADLHGIVVHQ
jgi:hypothetical protein